MRFLNFTTLKWTTRHIAVVVVVAAVLPLWFWYTFLRTVPVGTDGSATIASRFDGSAPETGPTDMPDNRLRELLPHPSTAFTYDRKSRSFRAYEEKTGRAFAVNPVTLRVDVLSESKLDGFVDTRWSPNGQEVISEFLTPNGTEYRYYDYRSGAFASLDPRTRLIAFSSDGSRIVTTRDTGTATELWVSQPDGSSAWRLTTTRLEITDISWPLDALIAVISERNTGTRDLSFIDEEGRLTLKYRGNAELETLWSPDASLILLSERSGERTKTSLWSVDAGAAFPVGEGIHADRCAWHSASDAFTCGMPDYGETARASDSSIARRDTIVTYALPDLEPEVRYEPPNDVYLGVRSPVTTSLGGQFAFINRFDQKPYLVSW